MDAARFHQVIPRPSTVRLGPAPSWHREGPTTPRPSLTQVVERLSPSLVPTADAPGATAAVLIGLLDLDGAAGVLLTRRAASMRSEPLTVSFPGGRLEPGESVIDAAVREAEEEIGLHASDMTVLGTFGSFDRRRDGEVVVPVVAVIDPDRLGDPNPDEVDEILLVELGELTERGAAWREIWTGPGGSREICFFTHHRALGLDLVWGLTARMLWELLDLVFAAPQPSALSPGAPPRSAPGPRR